MKTKKNPEMPMVPKAQLKTVEQQRDQYKTEYENSIGDVIWYKAKAERLERENEKLERTLKNRDDEKDWLERENEKYIKLLKEFNNLINYKLAIHPGSDVYMYYRSELDQLGVK